MASELNHLILDYLEQLPNHHPDRRFLEGLQETVASYVDRVNMPVEPDKTGVAAELPASAVTTAGSPEIGDAPDRESLASGPEQAVTPEQERIRLDGRIGSAVSFRKTNRGVHIAKFPIATHEADDTTTWHTVLAFNKLADKLWQDRPAKGAAATVVGYRHPREITGRDGQTKVVEDVYAVAVKLR